ARHRRRLSGPRGGPRPRRTIRRARSTSGWRSAGGSSSVVPTCSRSRGRPGPPTRTCGPWGEPATSGAARAPAPASGPPERRRGRPRRECHQRRGWPRGRRSRRRRRPRPPTSLRRLRPVLGPRHPRHPPPRGQANAPV
ncbi:MAG: hypothetical protein AVDCRST_MAG19-142, partial [uncultured Thermomicrobiales bacterium]